MLLGFTIFLSVTKLIFQRGIDEAWHFVSRVLRRDEIDRMMKRNSFSSSGRKQRNELLSSFKPAPRIPQSAKQAQSTVYGSSQI